MQYANWLSAFVTCYCCMKIDRSKCGQKQMLKTLLVKLDGLLSASKSLCLFGKLTCELTITLTFDIMATLFYLQKLFKIYLYMNDML